VSSLNYIDLYNFPLVQVNACANENGYPLTAAPNMSIRNMNVTTTVSNTHWFYYQVSTTTVRQTKTVQMI